MDRIRKKHRFLRHAAACGLLVLQAAGLTAGANLEEKIKYERALEQKVEEVLVNLLGPNKARVMIQAGIDFSAKESVVTEAGGAAQEAMPFKWQNINRSGDSAASQELLPGFPSVSRLNPLSPSEGGNFKREVVFPQSLVRKLTVSLVLNEDISQSDAEKVRAVVTDLLALDRQRGDEILITRARFAPMWYTPEMFNMLVKYTILALIVIAGMVIVAIGFLKMAGAMNNMAGAGPAQKVSMELGAGGGLGELEGEAEPPAPERKTPGAEGEAAKSGAPADGMEFNIRPEKLELLVSMLAKDEPADISLIAVHLSPELRSRFIGLLPPETASEVVANMARVRFVDPELISRIKEELEKRLAGAVGGYDKVMEVIEKASLKSKKALFENLAKKYPDVATQVRPRILFIEDIEKFSEKDLSILVGSAAVDQWSCVVWKLPDTGRAKLKAQMSERAWQMVEQTMKYGMPPEEKIDRAIEGIIASAWKLINEGRVANPNVPGPAGIGLDAKPAPAGKS